MVILSPPGLFGVIFTQKLFSSREWQTKHIILWMLRLGFRQTSPKPTQTEWLCSPEVVEVVELWWWQQRQVVSAVGDGGAEQSQAVPQAGGGQVGAQDHWSDQNWQRVGELQWWRNIPHTRRVSDVLDNWCCWLSHTVGANQVQSWVQLRLTHSPRAPEDVRRWRRLQWAPSTRGAVCGSACTGWDGGRACEEKSNK